MSSIKPIDWVFMVAALAFNLLIAGLFIAQKQGQANWVAGLGRAWLLTAIPLLAVFIAYLRDRKPAWVLWSLGVVLAYMLAEFLLDYAFRYDFRAQWSTHVPYILLEYGALFALIAVATHIERRLGWVVGGSFWVLLGSLIYLYAG